MHEDLAPPVTWTLVERAPALVYKSALRLMERLDALAATSRTKIMVVAQYPEWMVKGGLSMVRRVLDCARAQPHLETIDLWQLLEDLKATDRAGYARLYYGHMTEAGNRFVAEQLANSLADVTRP